VTILLAAVGAGVVILGAVVLILMPNRPGGTISWAGVQVNSAGAGLPLIVVGIAAIAVAVSRTGATGSPETTTQAKALLFDDDFSTPGERRWEVTAAVDGTGGRYENGAYRIVARRAAGGGAVYATARLLEIPRDVRVTVRAHRIGGTAREGFGYGLFCRGRAPDTGYFFTVFAKHSVIQKRAEGRGDVIGTASRVKADAEDDPVKSLEIVCARADRGRAARLELSVNGSVIVDPTDSPQPLEGGFVGLQVAMPGAGGELGDTLEVEFDDFKVTAE
jgi:hypothetical protein